MSQDSKTIVRRIYAAVDDLQRMDEQRLKQFIAAMRCRPAEEAFDALIGVFADSSREQTRYLDQEYAGRLLLAVQPPCACDVRNVVRRVLRTWDVSVEQLPLYFEAVAGRDAVLQALQHLENQPLSEGEQHAIRSFRYWLHANVVR